jgi:hypothetical protein
MTRSTPEIPELTMPDATLSAVFGALLDEESVS